MTSPARRGATWRSWAPALSFALWIPTTAGVVWAVVRGPPAPAAAPIEDLRQPIAVTAEEREIVLEVMRGNLVQMRAILEAQAAGDLQEVARIARIASDIPGPASRKASLKRKLPPAWRELGKQVDNTFAGVANRAAEGNTTGVTEQMAKNLQACVACHDMFRLVPEEAG